MSDEYDFSKLTDLSTIGKKVKKKSGKPFKSRLKENTVKGLIIHPHFTSRPVIAYTFQEDDSFVSMEQCEVC